MDQELSQPRSQGPNAPARSRADPERLACVPCDKHQAPSREKWMNHELLFAFLKRIYQCLTASLLLWTVLAVQWTYLALFFRTGGLFSGENQTVTSLLSSQPDRDGKPCCHQRGSNLWKCKLYLLFSLSFKMPPKILDPLRHDQSFHQNISCFLYRGSSWSRSLLSVSARSFQNACQLSWPSFAFKFC